MTFLWKSLQLYCLLNLVFCWHRISVLWLCLQNVWLNDCFIKLCLSGWNSAGPFQTTCNSFESELDSKPHLSLEPCLFMTLPIILAVASSGIFIKQHKAICKIWLIEGLYSLFLKIVDQLSSSCTCPSFSFNLLNLSIKIHKAKFLLFHYISQLNTVN